MKNFYLIKLYLIKKINNDDGILLFENLSQEKSSMINIDSIEKIKFEFALHANKCFKKTDLNKYTVEACHQYHKQT